MSIVSGDEELLELERRARGGDRVAYRTLTRELFRRGRDPFPRSLNTDELARVFESLGERPRIVHPHVCACTALEAPLLGGPHERASDSPFCREDVEHVIEIGRTERCANPYTPNWAVEVRWRIEVVLRDGRFVRIVGPTDATQAAVVTRCRRVFFGPASQPISLGPRLPELPNERNRVF